MSYRRASRHGEQSTVHVRRKAFPTLSTLIAAVTAAIAVSGCAEVENSGEGHAAKPHARAAVDRAANESGPSHRRERNATTRKRKASDRQPQGDALARCDANIDVDPSTTTCEFAQNVFYENWMSGGGRFRAYSPASRITYDVFCRDGAVVVCRAGDGAEVRFSADAVALYDQQQADDFAATHDLGPLAADNEPKTAEPDVGANDDGVGAECDPNYEGACLDPNSYDYDCESGEGDGPDYTGEVTIVGDDPYDLDRDGDGVACEPY